VIKTCYNNGQKERLCLIIDKCTYHKGKLSNRNVGSKDQGAVTKIYIKFTSMPYACTEHIQIYVVAKYEFDEQIVDCAFTYLSFLHLFFEYSDLIAFFSETTLYMAETSVYSVNF
jgi:hypothetical protein